MNVKDLYGRRSEKEMSIYVLNDKLKEIHSDIKREFDDGKVKIEYIYDAVQCTLYNRARKNTIHYIYYEPYLKLMIHILNLQGYKVINKLVDKKTLERSIVIKFNL